MKNTMIVKLLHRKKDRYLLACALNILIEISLKVILFTSQHCQTIQYPVVKFSSVIFAYDLHADFSVLDENDPFAIAGGIRVVGYQQDGGVHFLVHFPETPHDSTGRF
jgi:hypothetical protein